MFLTSLTLSSVQTRTHQFADCGSMRSVHCGSCVCPEGLCDALVPSLHSLPRLWTPLSSGLGAVLLSVSLQGPLMSEPPALPSSDRFASRGAALEARRVQMEDPTRF